LLSAPEGVSLKKMTMQKIKLLLLAIGFSVSCFAQADTSLQGRLKAFMQANEKLDFDKVLDYTYPKLFTLVPRNQMIDVMKGSFDNETLTVTMDSLRIVTIYPEYTDTSGRYAKIDYSMLMKMKFKEEEKDSTEAGKQKEFMLTAFREEYGEDNVLFDEKEKLYKIQIVTAMIAIKDSFAKEWSFINFKKDDPMAEVLLSAAVIEKMSSY
jgi:hypothetical protein